MADTAYENRRMRHPDVFYNNMGFEDGFNDRSHKYLSKPKNQHYYDNGYKSGEAYRAALEQDAANGEFSKMTRKLGSTQMGVLESLVQFGAWPGGWVWTSATETRKLCERLTELGYARKTTNVAGREVYKPTEAGANLCKHKTSRS